MKRKVLALVLSVITINLFFFSNWRGSSFILPYFGSLGFALVVLFANVVIQLLHPWNLTSNRKISIASSIVASVFSFVAVFRGSGLDAFILNFASFIATFIALFFILVEKLNISSWLDMFASPFLTARAWIDGAVDSVNALTKVENANIKFTKFKELKHVGIGIIVALPILFLMSGLLSSADPIFATTLGKIFNFQIQMSLFGRLIFSLVILSFIFPFFYAVLHKKGYQLETSENLAGKMTTTATTVVTLIALLLGLFLFVQFQYLFATVSETQLHQFGVQTYSEYVRRGFVELVFVSILTFFTSIGALYVFLNSQSKNRNILRWINFALLTELTIFIISVFRRVNLYQIEHGLTRARVYGSAILILMLILIVVQIWRHYRLKVKWLYFELSIIAIFILIISTIGVDRIIANDAPPTVNNEVDYVYISKLSPDAIYAWKDAYTHAKSEIGELEKTTVQTNDQKRRVIYAFWSLSALVKHYGNLEQQNDLRHFNFAKWGARNTYNLIIDYQDLVETQRRASALYDKFSTEPIHTIIDRSFDTPLLD